MAQTRAAARSEIKRFTDLVQEVVDDGVTTAEEIHKCIAALPLDVMEQLDVLPNTVEDVRKLQTRSIGAVYDLVRSINHEVAKLARGRLVGPASRRPLHKPAKPRKAVKKTQAA